MEETLKDNNSEKEAPILERVPDGYTRLEDLDLESLVANLSPEKLNVFSDYVSKSFLEQFGVKVEVAFVKELSVDKDHRAIIKTYLKAKELPEGIELEKLRLFKIMKDDDIHDGHYYISYDTKGIADLDYIYGDAVWFGADGLELEYELGSKYTRGKKIKLEVQRSLRHHLKQSGGTNRWEIEIPMKDMRKKHYLEVFENPSNDIAENICRTIVKKAGAYVVEQLKKMRGRDI
jgi:hypothetical protein